MPEIDVRILEHAWGAPLGPYTAAEFERRCLPTGGEGEIVVAGDHVLGGYLHGRGDEETKFTVDGRRWHRTGDAGYLDDRGRLWLLGRAAARLVDDRGILYPFAVECIVQQHDAVARAALAADRGRRVLAVELREPATRRVLEEIAASIAWARIDEVLPVPRVPVDRRHNAKVDYTALQAVLDRHRRR